MRCFLVLLSSITFRAGDDPKAAELARHQGTWAVASMEREGRRTGAEIVAEITRVVDGEHVTWKRVGKPFAGTTVKLDPSANPKAIDVTPDGGGSRDKPVLGIYKLDGDSLTICMADADLPRPVGFSSAKGSKQTLMVFRRVVVPPKDRPRR